MLQCDIKKCLPLSQNSFLKVPGKHFSQSWDGESYVNLSSWWCPTYLSWQKEPAQSSPLLSSTAQWSPEGSTAQCVQQCQPVTPVILVNVVIPNFLFRNRIVYLVLFFYCFFLVYVFDTFGSHHAKGYIMYSPAAIVSLGWSGGISPLSLSPSMLP